MTNIRVDLSYTIEDGSAVVFTAPCNCSDVDGLKVYYPDGEQEFVFKDAHGNALTGIGEAFTKDALVKTILDVTNGHAFIQNADTNSYIERTFVKIDAPIYTATPDTLTDVIASAQAGATVQLSAGAYDLLELRGVDAYPENLTIVGGKGVTVAGISITSGVKDQDINSAYANRTNRDCVNADVSNAIMPAGLTFKNIAFTDSFCLRNCGVDRLSIIGCTFTEGAYVAIEPNSMSDIYGADRTAASFNFMTRRTYARIIPKDFTIRDCTFEGTTGTEQSEDGDAAIKVRGVDGIVIYRNIINKASFSGVTVGGISKAECGIYSTGRISITNNTISNTNQRCINMFDIKDGVVTVAANLLQNANIMHSHPDQIIVQNCIDSSFAWTGKPDSDSACNYYITEEINAETGANIKKKLYVGDGITLANCKNLLADHTSNKNNPHGVTAEQIGVTDYVVESGTSGGWGYRKWSSGIAECWKAYLNIPYNSTSTNDPLPFTFVGDLSAHTLQTKVTVGGNLFAHSVVDSSGIAGFNTLNYMVHLFTFNNVAIPDNVTVRLDAYAIGRWK